MSNLRTAELSMRLTRFLARFSPPQGIKENPQAVQDEADALLRILLKYAPREDAGPWADRALEDCAMNMKTRAWPTMHELGAACSNMRKSTALVAADTGNDAAALDRMVAWFERFGTQMPGHGRPDRTAELIRRGVFADERAARFKGFDLSQEQRSRVQDQDEGREEAAHHRRVSAELQGMIEAREAARQGMAAGGRMVME